MPSSSCSPTPSSASQPPSHPPKRTLLPGLKEGAKLPLNVAVLGLVPLDAQAQQQQVGGGEDCSRGRGGSMVSVGAAAMLVGAECRLLLMWVLASLHDTNSMQVPQPAAAPTHRCPS